jgi:hypothetical protein
MPMITIPRDRYIVDVDSAPPTLLYQTLAAPPLVPLERAYSLDEIRDNVELRARVRSVEINTSTSQPDRGRSRPIRFRNCRRWPKR